jgi:nucleotide-binding universal stress UspA family protein
MKRIIVPINFSEVSIDTLEFALDLANAMNYHLRLLSVVNSGGSFFFWKPASKTSDEAEVKAKLEECMEKYGEQYTVEGGTFDYEIVQGSTIKTLLKAVASPTANTYAVVVGINKEYETNRETFSIITEMSVPIITWRKGFEHKAIKRILLPIDTQQITRQKVPFVTGFARRIGAEVDVLGCADSDDLASIKSQIVLHVEQTIDFLRQYGIPCTAHYKFGETVSNSVLEYANLLKTDMISLMASVADDALDLFAASNAEHVLNHAKQPVICIRPT